MHAVFHDKHVYEHVSSLIISQRSQPTNGDQNHRMSYDSILAVSLGVKKRYLFKKKRKALKFLSDLSNGKNVSNIF